MKSFRGTTAQCLTHLANAVAGPNFNEKRAVIADFTGVGEGTVQRWFTDESFPVGEALIRLRFYLEFLGYHVTELQSLNESIRKAARLFAFGIASITEIANLVGYKGNEKSANNILIYVLRGMQGVQANKIKQFDSFVELHGSQLEEKRRTTSNVLNMSAIHPHSPQASEHRATPTKIQSVHHEVSGNQSAVIESLAGMISAILPLAEYVLSDSFTAGQRACVRERASGGKGVSRLSHLLTQLSGEAARTALTKQQGEGSRSND